ncbi:MAG: hypothetical protein JO165_11395, partial [Candidatus Eremiobacteraeota bacterium]|nr:hypothetical protein [Candidatus Eremiobacteraeota bacterium]
MKQRVLEEASSQRPRLRYDKVALRFMSMMKDGVSDAVPDGKVVILTIAAPIRQASKTAVQLEAEIRGYLDRHRAATPDLCSAIQGNRIRVRVVNADRNASQKLIGFVYTDQTGAVDLLLREAEAAL